MKQLKACVLVVATLLAVNFAKAQTIEEGKQFLYYEKYISAKNTFQKLVSANPNNVDAVYWLGQTLIAPQDDKDIAAAKALYQKTLQANSNSPMLIAGMGHIALLEGNTQDARSQFETAISLSGGKNVAVLNAVGFANADFDSKAGDAAYAVEKLKQAVAIKAGSKDPDVLSNLGDAYRKMGDGGNAKLSYEAALAAVPNYARAKYRLGRIYQTQGRIQQDLFLQYYNEAIALDANYTPVYWTLFQYYYETDVPKAAGYLDKYLAAKGADEPNSCFLQAQMKYAQALYADAITSANACIAAAGATPYPNLYGLIAYASYKLGDFVTAKANFDLYFQKQKPAKLGPLDYQIYAEVLMKFPGNETLAATFIDKAVDLDSTADLKAGRLKSFGDTLVARKLYKDAADYYNRILSIKPSPSKTDLYNAGYNFTRGGDYQKSLDVFNKYIMKFPDETLGYYLNAKNYLKLDSFDVSILALGNYIKVTSMTEQLKDKPIERDRIKSSLRYLIEYYANTRGLKDSALYYTNMGITLDPADSDFVSMKRQIEPLNMKPIPPPRVTVSPNGDKSIILGDGTAISYKADGSVATASPNGTVRTVKDGVTTVVEKSGRITIYQKDGTYKIIEPPKTPKPPVRGNAPKKK